MGRTCSYTFPASPANKDSGVDPYRLSGKSKDRSVDTEAAVTSETHIQFTLAQA